MEYTVKKEKGGAHVFLPFKTPANFDPGKSSASAFHFFCSHGLREYWRSWKNSPPDQPGVTIKNPKVTPNWASACDNRINASQSGTVMRAYITNTCVGGIVYWIDNFTYSEHCSQSLFGWCWGGWDSTVGVPECDSHNISFQRCPSTGTYLRGASSGQLWRWRTETCIQFQPGDVAECTEETVQLQF